MKLYSKKIVLLGMFALLAGACAQAETWVLALTWAPGFCAQNSDKNQCALLARQPAAQDSAYGARHLTLHGLWPSRQYCPAVPLGAQDLPPDFQRLMPGVADGLPQYEWNKHGSCSGYPAARYFQIMASMARTVANSRLGAFLAVNAGKPVTLASMQAEVVRDYGASGAESVRFICSGVRLLEVRFSLSQAIAVQNPADLAPLLRPAQSDNRCAQNLQL